jgi:hypothetical protein
VWAPVVACIPKTGKTRRSVPTVYAIANRSRLRDSGRVTAVFACMKTISHRAHRAIINSLCALCGYSLT